MEQMLDGGGCDLLAGWFAGAGGREPRLRGGEALVAGEGLRFAFYGRMSTIEYQDRASSRQWQWDCAADVVAGRGVIVAEFFDAGVSRRRSWMERPGAAALLAAAAASDRGFDAVVVGEYERAFCGGQLPVVVARLAALGVQVWLPELGGPVDLADPAHAALVMLLGRQSRREVLRSRFRTMAAMRVQAREQGRHLGGRPPYGYRLVDAGPHPNAAHARWGRRLRRLDPDPVTASHVRWMFAQRLTGRSTAGIARELNERGVPCPSGYDRERNAHRSGEAWTLRSCGRDSREPAVHRSSGVEPAADRPWPGDTGLEGGAGEGQAAVESAEPMDRVPTGGPPKLGDRAGLRGRAGRAGDGHTGGWNDPRVSVHWVGAVRGV